MQSVRRKFKRGHKLNYQEISVLMNTQYEENSKTKQEFLDLEMMTQPIKKRNKKEEDGN